MRYYKGRWEEDRGDEFASWGASDWYFEVEADDTVVRQMEVYDAGVVLQYHLQHIEDAFGGLSDQAFDPIGFPCVEIAHEAFEKAWSARPPYNL